ncbi:MAG: acyl-CoA dehydrogenase [Phycisphaeraceae bacterium]|nr:acyl-CoA dehydrogenase [Phycisphaeraceae bacterium]|tara:strand:+ start:1599 stop:3410 length:1812 start_codon:yes stop_codon:yes gene_type:complete
MVQLAKHDQQQLDKAKDLIDAGPLREMGFVRSLLFGQLRLDKVMPYPGQDAQDAERTNALLSELKLFMQTQVDPDAIDANQQIPQHVIDGLGQMGVLGLTVPQEYGGRGFTHTGYCRALELVSRTCSSTAVLVGAHQSIGLKALVLNGTEEQKHHWLPELASGRQLAAFALTEPEAGSDAANVQTSAKLSDDGHHWVLNGEKKYITNGALAGMMTVMARTPIEENGKIKEKVTAFIVTPDMAGFEVVHPNRSKCGIRGTWQATLNFNNMVVPRQNVLGEVGRGLKVALTVLDYGRCTLSAGCIGGAKVALEMSVRHAQNRSQFDRSLSEFHLIKQKIARMSELVFAADALTYLAAGMVDRHDEDLMLETAICKLFCSEASWRVIDDAVQIHGGAGYMRENGLERMLRDARINRIVEGATEVMTSFVALMGMKEVGEDLERVLHAARRPIHNFGRLATFARHEWRDVIVGPSWTGLDPQLVKEGEKLAQLTRLLARSVTRLLAKHQQKVLDLQLLHSRLAWSVIELFTMSAVISKLQSTLEKNNGADVDRRQLNHDLVVGKGYCQHAARRIQRRLKGLFRNHDKQRLAVADEVFDFYAQVDGDH